MMVSCQGRRPSATSWGVWAAISVMALCLTQRTDAVTPCVPCGANVTWGREATSDVGFACQEGFPRAALRHPYTCIVTFQVPHNHTLTFYLHEIYTWSVSIEVCIQDPNRRYISEKDHKEENCKPFSTEGIQERLQVTPGGVYLNVTTIGESRRDLHLMHHDYYAERHGFNFTFELTPKDGTSLIGSLEYDNLQSCSYNGVPTLHQLPSGHFNFSCECPVGVSGAHCEWGDVCTREEAAALCSDQGECRHYAGVSTCKCDPEYYGPSCQFHYTTIPTNSVDCERRKACDHNCHLRVTAGHDFTYCSCRVGYTLVNDTRCKPKEEWDLAVTARFSKGHLSKEDIINKTHQVFSRADPGGNATKILHITTKKKKAEIEVGINGTNLTERLVRKELWQYNLGTKSVNIKALPQLSVGPMSVDLPEKKDRLELRCPVYGGPHLEVSWFKDGIPIYAHNVSSCSYDNRTSLLRVRTETDGVDHLCTLVLSVSPLEQMDHGIFACQVVDRGYNLTQMVVVGMNESLQAELTPFVHSVYPESNSTLNCMTKNRLWFDGDHYSVVWTVLPRDGYESLKEYVIFRSGFQIHITNITKSLNVTCKIVEKTGVMYLLGEDTQDVAEDAVEIHVLDRPACHEVSQYNVLWKPVPMGKRDVERCPPGFLGRAVRLCSPLPTPSPLPPLWETPDFSDCLYEPLRFIKTPLILYKRGYRTLSGGVDELARDFMETLQGRKTPLLPGEGPSLLQILEMLQEAGKEMQAVISQTLFFDIVHEIIKDHGSLTLMDVCKMNIPVRMYLRAGLKFPGRGGEVTRLPHLVAKREVIAGHQVFEMEGSQSRTDASLGAPTVQVSLEEPGILQTHALTQPRTQTMGPGVSLVVGVVAYLSPGLALDYDWNDDSPIKLVGSPVEIAWAVVENSSDISPNAESSASTMYELNYASRLYYSTCPDEANWELKCGRAQPNSSDISWDFSMCSVEALESGCLCRCRGKGLFGLVLVNGTSEDVTTPMPDEPRRDNYVTGISCITACLLFLLCFLLQLPRCCTEDSANVQLRAVKCVALAAFNGIFAAIVLWPLQQNEYLPVMLSAVVCYVLCVGTGVSQQMLVHHGLSLPSEEACRSPLCVSNIMIVLLTMAFGTLIWVVHNVGQYVLDSPWLSVGSAWPMTALTVGILLALTFLWATVAGHNLCQLSGLKDEPTEYAMVRDRIGQQVLVLVGEWVVLMASLVYAHHIGRYFFCFATVAQSLLIIIISRQDGVACCINAAHCRKSQSDCGGSSQMTYHLTSTGDTLYYKTDGPESYYRRESLPWKRPLRTPEGDLPRRPSLPSRVPFSVRRGSHGVSGTALSRPRNTFLVRGADLLRGEDSSEDQQDGLLKNSLSSEESVFGRTRSLAPATQRDFPLEVLRLPISQGRPGPGRGDPDGRYLDMTVAPYKEAAAQQRYMNVGKETISAAEKMHFLGSRSTSHALGRATSGQSSCRSTDAVHQNGIPPPNEESGPGTTHHYLPMKVNGHAMPTSPLPNGRRVPAGGSEGAMDYLLADSRAADSFTRIPSLSHPSETAGGEIRRESPPRCRGEHSQSTNAELRA